MYGISDPKNFRNPEFCKLIRPVGTNPLVGINEILKFLCAYEVYENISNFVSFGAQLRELSAENLNRAIFPKIYGSPWCKNYGSDPKKLGVQTWHERPLCTCYVLWRSVAARRQMKN